MKDLPATGSTGFKAVVVGGSAGGFDAVRALLVQLPRGFGLPVLVTLHRHPSTDGTFADQLGQDCPLLVVEPCDKQPIAASRVYLAPANYHMLVELDGSIGLSVDERVNWSRPSIDVLFESAARAWTSGVIAIVLSGANGDGSKGVLAVSANGGLALAQNPEEASFPQMPLAAIATGAVERVMDVGEMARFLTEATR